jgi:very-short-patch-repair endonuclease
MPPQTRAGYLRAHMPLVEVIFWDAVRRKQVFGLRFRRQFKVGPYHADFVCLIARLIIELDGGQHREDRNRRRDARRDLFLRSQNFHVLRFWNDEILHNIDGVMLRLHEVIQEQMKRLGRPLLIESA